MAPLRPMLQTVDAAPYDYLLPIFCPGCPAVMGSAFIAHHDSGQCIFRTIYAPGRLSFPGEILHIVLLLLARVLHPPFSQVIRCERLL